MQRAIQMRYPLMATDLKKSQLAMLIQILNLQHSVHYTHDNMGRLFEVRSELIHHAIRNLPSELRKSTLLQILPNSVIRAAELCPSHQGINPYIVANICSLIRKEVTEHLDVIDWYSDNLDQSHVRLVRALQSMQGMWSLVPLGTRPPPIAPAPYQENRCEACILARVVQEPMFLQNLRVALISRTRTRSKHRAPRLLAFIDQAINYYGDRALQYWHASGQAAFDFKAARKAAVRAYKKRPQRIHRREDYTDHLRKHPKNKGRSIRLEPGQRESAGFAEAPGYVTSQRSSDDDGDDMQSIVVYMDHSSAEQQGLYRNASQRARVHSHHAEIVNERDTVADEIIATYEAFGARDWAPRSTTNLPAGVPPVHPLSVPGADHSVISASRYDEDHPMGEPSYMPPRNNSDWRSAGNGAALGTLEALSKEIGELALGGPPGEDTEELADRYCELLSPVAYHSDSEYSETSWMDDPVRDAGPGDTTWDLVCKESY
ncbi:hypothetical protein KXW98_002968 [Aspergillus fumigatus]|uniref:Uncharacterized protein n=2 Tax=Aspergillus fumigatus TaxID=746128 RepID=Q4WRB6_ASPFU|nr:conserved hypothetical protein [Aspergillus fumigatus Af293]EDP56903.1 conserved hypothetical protein [Aspergillus fumigatus A1163]KAF4269239.1 hypothetical protein CNMCM8714_008883 [Aspergillus fumigatus]KMK55525.1 hypothetical protein Y699_08959 [Aspergillus fumigatus Z5]EAL91016.1 conserved hypothetical protein [Aspergillus fumigatus Af293]KAF4274684.1 hypothetical protein CNMCM8812_004549 [Aspergillus fumigatus]